MTDASTSAQIRRLRAGDRDLARHLFAVMAEVFQEPCERLSDSYLDALLGRDTFWAIAALSHDEVVGGLTAHTLPMTRAESGEVFIYDVAVRADRQRRGIGRQLVTVLCAAATAAGFGDVFVPVDSTDGQALDFYRALGGVPIFRQDSQTYLLEAVSKKHERIIRLLDEVRAEYRPEYGVDRDRRRYAFNGVLHTFRDREFGARAPSASRRTA